MKNDLILPAVSFLALMNTACAPQSEGKDYTNFVIINLDDSGYGDFSHRGATGYTTPNIDRLAAEGVQFTHCLAAQPVSSASRVGLLTGCYPNRLGLDGAFGTKDVEGVHQDEQLLSELLKEKGYATAIFGKWHLGTSIEFWPLQNGFDEFYGIPYSNDMWPYHPTRKRYPDLPTIEGNKIVGYNTDQCQFTTDFTNRTVDFIERNKDREFFVYLAHPMPHVPLFVSEKFAGKSEAGLFGDVMMEIDWSVGKVMEALEANGIAENTLVILTSDNGPWLSYGNHAGSSGGLREGKRTSFEGGNRVACVMSWKGTIKPGTVCSKLISNVDFLPTITQIAGAKQPTHPIDGVNIEELIMGMDVTPRSHFAYYYGKNNLEAVTDGRFKLIFPHVYNSYQNVGADGMPKKETKVRVEEMELYDLRFDPGEARNVISQYPEKAKDLEEYAQKVRAKLGDDLTDVPGSERREAGRVKKVRMSLE